MSQVIHDQNQSPVVISQSVIAHAEAIAKREPPDVALPSVTKVRAMALASTSPRPTVRDYAERLYNAGTAAYQTEVENQLKRLLPREDRRLALRGDVVDRELRDQHPDRRRIRFRYETIPGPEKIQIVGLGALLLLTGAVSLATATTLAIGGEASKTVIQSVSLCAMPFLGAFLVSGWVKNHPIPASRRSAQSALTVGALGLLALWVGLFVAGFGTAASQTTGDLLDEALNLGSDLPAIGATNAEPIMTETEVDAGPDSSRYSRVAFFWVAISLEVALGAYLKLGVSRIQDRSATPEPIEDARYRESEQLLEHINNEHAPLTTVIGKLQGRLNAIDQGLAVYRDDVENLLFHSPEPASLSLAI